MQGAPVRHALPAELSLRSGAPPWQRGSMPETRPVAPPLHTTKTTAELVREQMAQLHKVEPDADVVDFGSAFVALCDIVDRLRTRAFVTAAALANVNERLLAVSERSHVVNVHNTTSAGRENRQVTAFGWAVRAFGAIQVTSLPQRGLRLLEEACEAYQAAGGTAELAHKLVDHVFSRPAGTLAQELGGVGVTLLVLAQAANLSADTEEMREVERVLSLPVEHFAKRNEAKNAAGLVDAEVAQREAEVDRRYEEHKARLAKAYADSGNPEVK